MKIEPEEEEEDWDNEMGLDATPRTHLSLVKKKIFGNFFFTLRFQAGRKREYPSEGRKFNSRQI